MNAVCVDRDEKTLALAAEVCEAHPLLNEVRQFTCARDCLLWLEGNPVNLAVLEVELADVDGLLLASEIKRKCPTAAIVLVASSIRKKEGSGLPAALGLNYFREER